MDAIERIIHDKVKHEELDIFPSITRSGNVEIIDYASCQASTILQTDGEETFWKTEEKMACTLTGTEGRRRTVELNFVRKFMQLQET